MSQSSLNIPNLDKLIAHLEAQSPERINMAYVEVEDQGACGTCGCIYGHAMLVWPFNEKTADSPLWPLNLPAEVEAKLTTPRGYSADRNGAVRYPARRVIATLKRLRDTYLRTSEVVVDWGPEPGEEPAQPWSAPQARELTPPALPETITRFLAAEPVTTGTEGR